MRRLLAVLLLVPACVQKPAVGSERIKGEDGSDQVLVLCRYDETYCRREAGRMCPTGYDVIERPPKTKDHWSMVVRCKSSGATTEASAPRESF